LSVIFPDEGRKLIAEKLVQPDQLRIGSYQKASEQSQPCLLEHYAISELRMAGVTPLQVCWVAADSKRGTVRNVVATKPNTILDEIRNLMDVPHPVLKVKARPALGIQFAQPRPPCVSESCAMEAACKFR
jgi:hypothetical protein